MRHQALDKESFMCVFEQKMRLLFELYSSFIITVYSKFQEGVVYVKIWALQTVPNVAVLDGGGSWK